MPDMDEAKAFLDAEIGDMSSLDRAAQEAEMQWFIDAAKPFAGMDDQGRLGDDHHA
jgi:glycerol transport system substrate-binding protein